MRRTLAFLVAAGLVMGAGLPAVAGKPKKVAKSFTATAAPFANYSSITGTEKPGCLAGQEDVHYVTEPFTAPGTGKLTAHLRNFQGDWDLYLTDPAGTPLIRSENEQLGSTGGGATAHEVVFMNVKKGKKVGITACNWLGQPEVTITYTFVGR